MIVEVTDVCVISFLVFFSLGIGCLVVSITMPFPNPPSGLTLWVAAIIFLTISLCYLITAKIEENKRDCFTEEDFDVVKFFKRDPASLAEYSDEAFQSMRSCLVGMPVKGPKRSASALKKDGFVSRKHYEIYEMTKDMVNSSTFTVHMTCTMRSSFQEATVRNSGPQQALP